MAASIQASLLYEQTLRVRPGPGRLALKAAWTLLGLGGLTYLAWTGPFSGRLLQAALETGYPRWLIEYLGIPLVMSFRAVLIVESIGYAYHRFFQHVGFFTRRAQVIRRNQRYHWIHHMVIYPIGRFYRRATDYVSSEEGIAWSWYLPAMIVSGLFVVSNGLNLGTVVFLASVAVYAKGIVDTTHTRFHMTDHPWVGKRYFRWLEEIHLLHHWDQRTNFTICHPAMDVLFGTYLPPRTHRKELEIALEDRELTVSDLINWRYLLIEATPAEYAAFITAAKRHPRSLRKIGLLLTVLKERMERAPEDSEAGKLHQRALELLQECGKLSDVLPEHVSQAASV